MKNRISVPGKAVYLLLPAFFLSRCSGGSGTVPVVHVVEIRQMQFQPSELRVQKGDTVVFINKDLVVHDVAEETNKAWASSPLPPGKSYSLIVNSTADYYCTIHPVMKGKLVVP